MNRALQRFLKYAAVGTFSFAVDLVLLYIMTSVFLIFYALSAVIAFILANSVNYYLNRKWGYRGTLQKPFKGYFSLMSINLASLILIIGFMSLLVEIYSMNYLLARIIVGILVGVINFMANSKITFKKSILRD